VLRAPCSKYLRQYIAALVKLLVGKRHRGEQSQDGLLCAVDQEAALEALLYDRHAVHGKLQADHEPAYAEFLADRQFIG
jgi:hypothetical protein